MAQLIGKWEQKEAENFDEYLKAMDVNIALRKIAGATKSTMEFTEKDGEWTIQTKNAVRNIEVKFKCGVPFEEKDLAGRMGTSVFKLDGDKLIKEQTIGNLKTTMIREVKDGMMVLTMIAPGDVTAYIRYTKA